LIGELQKAGLHSWLDLDKILVGDSIARQIQDGLETSQYVIAVISENSAQSDWAQSELDMALALEAGGRILKVLPVVIDHTGEEKLPVRLRGRAFADFRRNFSEGLFDLTRSIR